MMTNFGMNPVGKINRVGTFRQDDQIPSGREDKNFVAEKIQLQRLKIFFRVFDFLLQLRHLTQPRNFLVSIAIGSFGRATFFVLPMSRHSVFRNFMHCESPNLNFERVAQRHNGRVQRAIAITFGHSDIIFETSRNWSPLSMNHAQDVITVLHVVDQNPHR